MTDFDHSSVIENNVPKDNPPSQIEINASEDTLHDRKQEEKLINEKIRLFRYAVYGALGAFISLIILLACVVIVYLDLLYDTKSIPENFWHIPLLVALMASTILSVTLTLSSRFGDVNKKEHDDKDSQIVNSVPAIQELITTIKELIQKRGD